MSRGRAYGSTLPPDPPKTRRRRELGTAQWQRLRKEVLLRDLYRCHWCGGEATEADHVLPVSHGGAHYDPDNVVASCRRCNLARPADAYSGQVVHRSSAYSARSSAFSRSGRALDAVPSHLSPLPNGSRTTTARNVRDPHSSAPEGTKLAPDPLPVLSGDYSQPVHTRVHNLTDGER